MRPVPAFRTIRFRRRGSAENSGTETGAVLLLALAFMLVTTLVITGLLSWSGNNISNVASFEKNRVLDYALNSGVETAIQSVRYSTTACPAGGFQIPVPNSNSSLNQLIDVWCNTVTVPESIETRTVTLTACTDTAVIQGNCSTANPYLTVVVIFDDYADVGNPPIPPVASPTYVCTATCGASMGVQSWTFRKA